MAKKMKKKCKPGRKMIKIPAHLEKEAYLYAGQYVKNALGVHERDPEFKQVVDKAAKRFLTDTYEHSLTPHVKTPGGDVSPNPYKVSETVPFTVDLVNVKGEIGKLSTPEQKIRWATFYSSVASMVHSFLKLKFAWKANELDASGKPMTSMPVMGKGTGEDRRKAIGHVVFRNRYIRQIANIITVMVVDELFAVGGDQITNVAESILDAYEPVDLLTRGTNNMILKRIIDQLGGFDFATEVNDKLAEIADNMRATPAVPSEGSAAPTATSQGMPLLVDHGDLSERTSSDGVRAIAGDSVQLVQKRLTAGRRASDKPVIVTVKSSRGNFKLTGQKTIVARLKAIFEKLEKLDVFSKPEELDELKKKHPSVKFMLAQLELGRTAIAVEDVLGAIVKPNPGAKRRRNRDFT